MFSFKVGDANIGFNFLSDQESNKHYKENFSDCQLNTDNKANSPDRKFSDIIKSYFKEKHEKKNSKGKEFNFCEDPYVYLEPGTANYEVYYDQNEDKVKNCDFLPADFRRYSKNVSQHVKYLNDNKLITQGFFNQFHFFKF